MSAQVSLWLLPIEDDLKESLLTSLKVILRGLSWVLIDVSNLNSLTYKSAFLADIFYSGVVASVATLYYFWYDQFFLLCNDSNLKAYASTMNLLKLKGLITFRQNISNLSMLCSHCSRMSSFEYDGRLGIFSMLLSTIFSILLSLTCTLNESFMARFRSKVSICSEELFIYLATLSRILVRHSLSFSFSASSYYFSF